MDPKPHDLYVPSTIRSDYSDDEADCVRFVPSEVACERVVFTGPYDGPDVPDGYALELTRLRRDPARWLEHLSQKKTRQGYRPAVDMLVEALERERPRE